MIAHLHGEIGHQAGDSKSHQQEVCEDERSQGVGHLLDLLVSALFLRLAPEFQSGEREER